MNDYDPRYLAGVVLFNAGDFFEAHEIWEDLWAESHGPTRKFYQGLIQAAVGLCHFTNGNLGGAGKLYRSSRDYHKDCGDHFLGLDLLAFWNGMEQCFRPILGSEPVDRTARPTFVPQMKLSPEPTSWPDPDEFLHDEQEDS